MDFVIKVFGIFLVLFGVGFPVWWLIKRGSIESRKGIGGKILTAGGLAGFFGVALIIQDRITTLKTPIGTIQAATEQAVADAGDVSKLRTQAQVQTATINLVASEATKAKELSETVVKQVMEAEKKLIALDAATNSAQVLLKSIKEDEDFTMAVIGAQNNDREMFDQLKKIAGDKSNKFSSRAYAAWNQIFLSHSRSMYDTFTVPWSNNIDPSSLSFDKLSTLFQETPSSIQPALIEYISKREDIHKVDRLEFMVNVIKNNKNLMNVEYAGRYFTRLTGQEQKINPMALDYLVSWWGEHRHEFEGK
ncbi:hypothetical protein [Acetobacter fallax]|uniref:Uncharacterized protein n=1 Tax=Acetobacter fallax TaxID=1737473 RepID=A0ABX0KG97_9PROT|nr:hypothetical protein [Acetobacter fallax]NHO33435.1 hypothetical protein [Acetobacter fallax]NHO37086.1 hypothetical protein [Acetobacter fallax]